MHKIDFATILRLQFLKEQQRRLPTYLSNSTQQSPSWEANSSLASQETPRILWSPKVHYRIHKSHARGPIVSQINHVHASTSYFLKIHFNIILPPTYAYLNTSYVLGLLI